MKKTVLTILALFLLSPFLHGAIALEEGCQNLNLPNDISWKSPFILPIPTNANPSYTDVGMNSSFLIGNYIALNYLRICLIILFFK